MEWGTGLVRYESGARALCVLLAVVLAVALLLGFVNREPTFEGNVLVQIDGDVPKDEADQYDEALQET